MFDLDMVLPEKVGGWSSLVTDTIVGVARREFAFVDLDGNRYVAIGTDKFLLYILKVNYMMLHL